MSLKTETTASQTDSEPPDRPLSEVHGKTPSKSLEILTCYHIILYDHSSQILLEKTPCPFDARPGTGNIYLLT